MQSYERRVAQEQEARRAAIKLGIGSPESDVITKLGMPIEVNRTVTRAGVRKQLVYPGRVYVYTENGVVTAWQD